VKVHWITIFLVWPWKYRIIFAPHLPMRSQQPEGKPMLDNVVAQNVVTKTWEEWCPRSYLNDHYLDICSENFGLLQFMVNAFRLIPPDGLLLDFGCGPTINAMFPVANHVREIHLCDYLEANLDEVKRWLMGEPSAFDWSEYVKVTLTLENGEPPDALSIAQREAVVRQRVTQLLNCDASKTPPLDSSLRYDILVTNYCIDGATDNYEQWRSFFHNAMTMLKPGGILLLSAIKGANYWIVEEHRFPAIYITESDLMEALIEEGFEPQSIHMESLPAADVPTCTYEGVIMVMARKREGG
jgi:hypothetical protein